MLKEGHGPHNLECIRPYISCTPILGLATITLIKDGIVIIIVLFMYMQCIFSYYISMYVTIIVYFSRTCMYMQTVARL